MSVNKLTAELNSIIDGKIKSENILYGTVSAREPLNIKVNGLPILNEKLLSQSKRIYLPGDKVIVVKGNNSQTFAITENLDEMNLFYGSVSSISPLQIYISKISKTLQSEDIASTKKELKEGDTVVILRCNKGKLFCIIENLG